MTPHIFCVPGVTLEAVAFIGPWPQLDASNHMSTNIKDQAILAVSLQLGCVTSRPWPALCETCRRHNRAFPDRMQLVLMSTPGANETTSDISVSLNYIPNVCQHCSKHCTLLAVAAFPAPPGTGGVLEGTSNGRYLEVGLMCSTASVSRGVRPKLPQLCTSHLHSSGGQRHVQTPGSSGIRYCFGDH